MEISSKCDILLNANYSSVKLAESIARQHTKSLFTLKQFMRPFFCQRWILIKTSLSVIKVVWEHLFRRSYLYRGKIISLVALMCIEAQGILWECFQPGGKKCFFSSGILSLTYMSRVVLTKWWKYLSPNLDSTEWYIVHKKE